MRPWYVGPTPRATMELDWGLPAQVFRNAHTLDAVAALLDRTANTTTGDLGDSLHLLRPSYIVQIHPLSRSPTVEWKHNYNAESDLWIAQNNMVIHVVKRVRYPCLLDRRNAAVRHGSCSSHFR